MDRREAGDLQAAVSRTPFREAIWILAREGVIEINPTGATRTTDILERE
jgi:DNA-binding GntR family transcriptional regulator